MWWCDVDNVDVAAAAAADDDDDDGGGGGGAVKVSKKNLMEIVKKLMLHMDKAEGSHYRDELLSKIIEICSQSNYQFITNFEWYSTVTFSL